MERYAVYLRKSRADLEAEAHGEGETLARHEQVLIELAASMGILIQKIYREIVSGETISARPVMRQLLHDVESELWSGVLVMEVERLARGDTIDQGTVARTFKYSKTAIITPLKVYRPWEEFDEEYFEFGLFMSRREYKTILRRMQNGRCVSASEGKYCGSVAPYGYSRKKLPDEKGFTLQPVSKEAEVVRMIFSLASSVPRLGCSKIAERLTLLQIPTPSHGNIWSASTVSDILHNPVYCGMIRWGARKQTKSIQGGQIVRHRPRNPPQDIMLTDGKHPAIVDKALWERVQQDIASATHPVHKDKSLQNPLAGLIFCGECGRPLTRRSAKEPMLICTTKGCPTVGSKLCYVEEALLSCLSRHLERCVFDSPNSNTAPHRQELVLLRQNLEDMRKRSELLCSLLEEGVYSKETFLLRKQKNDEQTAAVQKAIEDISREKSCETENIARGISITQLINIYRTSDAEAKNRILTSLFNKIIYRKEKGGLNHQTAFRLYIQMGKTFAGI